MRLMAPTSKNRLRWRLSAYDIAWALAAPFIALTLRDPGLLEIHAGSGFLPAGYQFAAIAIAFSILVFLFFRIGDGMSRFFSSQDLWSVIAATLTTVAATSLTLFIINRLDGVPRSTPLIYGLVLAAGLLGGRTVARMLRTDRWIDTRQGDEPHLRRVIIIGVDRFAAVAIKLTDCQHPRTTQVVAALDARERLSGRMVGGVNIVGRPDDLEPIIEEYLVHGVEIDEVWLTDNTMKPDDAIRIEQLCYARGVKARSISDALNLTQRHGPIFRAPFPRALVPSPHVGYFSFKRALDVIVATILIILLAPLAAIVAGLTYRDVGGPVIFWQRRIGHGGREFFLYKFRTYQAPYSRCGDPIPSDERLSGIGNIIRMTRLDEIPQIINVLRGDMSLIGPRPLLPKDQPADPSSRLLVRPGVTGWAQVNGGTMVTTDEKDALDVWYIHHASPALDMKILIRTLKIVFRGEMKHYSEIETALKWQKKARQIDERLFADGNLSTADARA
ncbi:MAG: sugar transferase [Alphaproteobacteria bacterium]|nr:sugar transferase [Alphaproteobacteria bacterium]